MGVLGTGCATYIFESICVVSLTFIKEYNPEIRYYCLKNEGKKQWS